MIYLFDFNDSFTFNIYSQLKLIDSHLSIKVIAFENSLNTLEELLDSTSKAIIIFGPGPGHPNEYEEISKTIPKILQVPNFFFLGICLGHQLLWHSLGYRVSKSSSPIHGQNCIYNLKNSKYFRELLKVKGSKIEVQRYNSLCVLESEFVNQLPPLESNLFFANEELMMSAGNNFLTYQFHPESVGTSCPSLYFTPMVEFLL